MRRYLNLRFWRSLNQAGRGMQYAWRTQGHLQFQVLAGAVVLCFAWWSRVTRFEWLVLILAIGSVIGAEVVNSAIEIAVDLAHPNFHPLAGMAKDVAAGAVLVSVIQAIVIGLIVFWPPLFRMADKMF